MINTKSLNCSHIMQALYANTTQQSREVLGIPHNWVHSDIDTYEVYQPLRDAGIMKFTTDGYDETVYDKAHYIGSALTIINQLRIDDNQPLIDENSSAAADIQCALREYAIIFENELGHISEIPDDLLLLAKKYDIDIQDLSMYDKDGNYK